MEKKLLKNITLVCVLSVIGIISTGCSGANADMAGGRQVTVGETEKGTTMDSSMTEGTSGEIFRDETIRNNTHTIFDGIIGQTEVRMRISRKDKDLTAAYITRMGDENFFEGEMKNPAEFELKDDKGGYLKGTIQDGNINGTGMILGESIVFVMNLDTFFPIGYDYDNYYSGVVALSCSSKEVEEFAQQIKDSIHNKEIFLELFTYPLEIRIEGEAITVNSKEEMAKQYDFLISEEHFREQIENMYTKYLFLTYDGICVENGIIWFMKDNNDNYKIWALNVRKPKESELPDVFPLEFVFCSGAGAWRTTIVLNQDGSFSGEYLDSDMGDSGNGYPKGTQYICSFRGQFAHIKQIDNHTFSMKLAKITAEEGKGEEWIEDGVRIIYSEPYGMEDGTQYFLYTPETKIEELPEDIIKWYPGWKFADEDGNCHDTLSCYGIYNVKMGYGFFEEGSLTVGK